MTTYTSRCAGALARGDAAINLRFPHKGYREKIWDHVAGALIVEEAGGKISDASGVQHRPTCTPTSSMLRCMLCHMLFGHQCPLCGSCWYPCELSGHLCPAASEGLSSALQPPL